VGLQVGFFVGKVGFFCGNKAYLGDLRKGFGKKWRANWIAISSSERFLSSRLVQSTS
jgi:hypothetical protein